LRISAAALERRDLCRSRYGRLGAVRLGEAGGEAWLAGQGLARRGLARHGP
jgi:hypothetical protein